MMGEIMRKTAIGLFMVVMLFAAPASAIDVKKFPGSDSPKKHKADRGISTGGIDFTAQSICEGAWFMFDDNVQADAEADQCTVNQTNNATEFGNPTYISTDTPAGTPADRNSVTLDGTLDRFDVADGSDEFDSTDFALGCWVKRAVAGGTAVIMRKGTDLFTANMHVNVGAEGSIRYWQNNAQGIGAITATDDEWTHVTMSYSALTATVDGFRNGIDNCDGTCVSATARSNNAEPLGLGDTGGAQNFEWEGQFYECFYFGTNVSPTTMCNITLCGMDGLADGEARDSAFGTANCGCEHVACC